jgi:hypothetical protein
MKLTMLQVTFCKLSPCGIILNEIAFDHSLLYLRLTSFYSTFADASNIFGRHIVDKTPFKIEITDIKHSKVI